MFTARKPVTNYREKVEAAVEQPVTNQCFNPTPPSCPQLPGTILRIFIPGGTVINLLNLLEVASPSGVCLIVRLPILGGGTGGFNLQSIINTVQQAGESVEVISE